MDRRRCFQAGPCFGSPWARGQARVSSSVMSKFLLSSSEPKGQASRRSWLCTPQGTLLCPPRPALISCPQPVLLGLMRSGWVEDSQPSCRHTHVLASHKVTSPCQPCAGLWTLKVFRRWGDVQVKLLDPKVTPSSFRVRGVFKGANK